ncbi:MAG: hypothetical protein HQL05_02835 [Nitrospirae bacterium]|uniref:hypothetical protein n=1 Tax=Candidatus Magnetobacterium casense TaxID=1455061 RepID=UPI00058FBD2C|nr:hypothetical protein [Candidatus Magnetobacterium casensis]MBF0336744.1 hypothetical protein [Nitrospirota bacterium]
MKAIETIEQEICNVFSIYAGACLKVQSDNGQLLPFLLNEIQRLLEEIIRDIRNQGRLVRLLILKARREGVSTWVAGRFYWKTTTHFNRYAAMLTHEPEATEFIFNMTRRFHRHIPWEFRPAQLHNNKKEIEFNTASGLGLDGAIRVGTAGKTDFGSGQLIHYLHLSEVAKWPTHTASDLLTSLLQCVPDQPETEVIFESTAKGPSGEFYERFFSARYVYELYRDATGKAQFKSRINERSSVSNVYSAVFIPWFVFDGYRLDGGQPLEGSARGEPQSCRSGSHPPLAQSPGLILNEDESALRDICGVDEAQLLWRRQAIENRCGGDILRFRQEYPASAVEAFVSTSASVFNTQKILRLMADAREPAQRYECELGTGQWRPAADGRLRVWEEPVAGGQYLISADVSEGLEGHDYSCAEVIWRPVSGGKGQVAHMARQVAEWHGFIEPDLFGVLLAHLGGRYNNAWLVPERNNHGLTTITKLVELNYPRIYSEMVLVPPVKPRRRLGWLSTRTSKELIINNLIAEIRDDCHGIVSREVFEEMLTFIRTQGGQCRAQNAMHDDRVMAMAIGRFVCSKLPPLTHTQQRGVVISTEAWT